MDIKLYYYPGSRAGRVRWLLEELQQPYTLETVDIFAGEGQTPEYKRIQPHGAVPAVEINGEVMFESCAICHWLTDQFPDKGLAPPLNSRQRQLYEQWLFYVPATMEPPLWENFLHSKILPEDKRVADIIPWNISRFQTVLAVLDDKLGDKDYFVCDQFTTADLLIGSMLMWESAKTSDYPKLQAFVDRLKAREAYQLAKG